PADDHPTPHEVGEVRLYSHSNFFYWWPVWAVGYTMAILTAVSGQLVQIGGHEVLMHPSKNPGVIYTFTFFLVILITNVSLRGLSSLVVLLAAAFLILLFAYLDWWTEILNWMGKLTIHMNVGFYLFFSTLIFLVWAFSVFVYDKS